MKLLTIFVVFGIIFNAAIVGALITADYYLGEKNIEKQVGDYLQDVAASNAKRIENRLTEHNNDGIFFLSLSSIQKIFDVNEWGKVESSKREVRKITKDMAKLIEAYIIDNPEKTIKDLQEDEKFNDILDKKIKEEGYFILMDSTSLISYFHPEERRINYDYHNFKYVNPSFWEIIAQTFQKEEAEGVYSRQDLSGVVRDKYAYAIPITESTADNRKLVLFSTVYLDEYLEIDFEKKSIEQLNTFYGFDDYENVLFFNPNGEVLINLKNKNLENSVMTQLYENIKSHTSTHIIEIVDPESKVVYNFVSSPYLEGESENRTKELRGFLIFQLSIDKLNEIIYAGSGFKNLTSVYFIDDNKNILMSSDFKKIGQQFPDSENVRNCFESKKIMVKNNISTSTFEKYTNSLGQKMMEANHYVQNPPGCIITEIDYDDLSVAYPSAVNYLSIVRLFILLWIIGIIFIFIIDRAFELKRRRIK